MNCSFVAERVGWPPSQTGRMRISRIACEGVPAPRRGRAAPERSVRQTSTKEGQPERERVPNYPPNKGYSRLTTISHMCPASVKKKIKINSNKTKTN